MVGAPAARPGIADLFAGLVPDDVAGAYERLLATDGIPSDEAAGQVGARLTEELTLRGMAHILPHTTTDPAWLRPAPPDLALQGILSARQADLARGQQLLLDGYHRLADAQARYSTGLSSRLPEHLVGMISDRAELASVSAALMNTARRDWMTLDNQHAELPVTAADARPPLPGLVGQVRFRAIYAAAMMDDPATRENIQACADAGEEARLLPEVPVKLRMADTATAVLSLTPAGTAALVIRAPVVLAALRDYFDLLWERATPLNAPPPPTGAERPTPAQQKVLELMARGLNDDAIARRLDISTTTVRRHITALGDRLGTSSRFALGAAAQRRGWIG